MMRRKTEVVFSATIDVAYDSFASRQERRSFDDILAHTNTRLEHLQAEVGAVLTRQLPSDLRTIFGIETETRIIATRSGSILVFFGVLLSAYSIVANYKDFFDSIKLIAKHAERLLYLMLKDKYSGLLRVSVTSEYPPLIENDIPILLVGPLGRWRLRSILARNDPVSALDDAEASARTWNKRSSRDAFFWFLLVACIVLACVVGVLVYRAVLKTYFL